MLSVVQAFDRFLTSLEITDAERAEVASQRQTIDARLANQLGGVRSAVLGGAFARGTAVRPYHAIDLFIVLDEATHADLRGKGPKACLEAIHTALGKGGGSSTEVITRRDRAVNLKLDGDGIGFDLIPAFEESPGVYSIPDAKGEDYHRTNPAAIEAALLHAHERAAAKLIPVIRAGRHWSARHENPIAGFYLEALAPKAILTPPLNYPSAVRQLFAKVGDMIHKPCPDPGGVGPAANAGLSPEQESRVQIMFQDATRQADQALQYDRTWRAQEAHAVWRLLLGDTYPESGRK